MPRPKPDLAALQAEFSDYIDKIELFGSGGQALLYRGRRFRTTKGVDVNQNVTIKLYLDPAEDSRIEKEIAAAKDAKCDSLIKVVAHGNFSLGTVEYRFVVWEFVEGETLDKRLEQTGACSPSLVSLIGRDVANAIDALWNQRVVHRDINPRNVIIRQGDESAVLIDLGLVKQVERSALTAPGFTWGTSGYLSPEQLAGSTLTCQSDIFSLGVTLQYALLGSHPTDLDQFELLNGGKPTHKLCPLAPAALATVIDRMLQQRPARRPQITELINELSTLAETL